MPPGFFARVHPFPSFLLLYILLLCSVTFQDGIAQVTQSCNLRNGKNYFDLSNLTKSSKPYQTIGDEGDSKYYFNFCSAVTLGGCTPDQAVCKVNNGYPHGCGSAYNRYLEQADDFIGVKIKYMGGEFCSQTQQQRNTTINVMCNTTTDLEILRAREVSECVTEIDIISKCGCPILDQEEPPLSAAVDVFLVIHSHNDVGWKSTMDDYYKNSVRDIYKNVISALSDKSNRTFAIVEQAYFSRFWNESNNETRTQIKSLVDKNQLIFPMGGWVMPDEATPTYSSIISQLTEGHQFLLQNLNYTPSVSWQVDSFGSSSVVAELFKLSNFSGHVINRISLDQLDYRNENKSMDFYWLFGSQSERILTHVTYPLYTVTLDQFKQVDFDFTRVFDMIIEYARDRTQWSRSTNVMIPIGGDFSYANATVLNQLYEVLDKVIASADKAKILNVSSIRYSNISDYFTALNKTKNLPTFRGDIMPYNENNNGWWTGFYTSRPALKGLIRESESVLRAAETLFSAAGIYGAYNYTDYIHKNITDLSHAVSINTHHQAITGTSAPDVVTDFYDMLNSSLPVNKEGMAVMMDLLANQKNNFATQLNLSTSTDVSVNTATVVPVMIYNSLGWIRSDYVSVRLASYNVSWNYTVALQDGTPTKFQVIPDYAGTTDVMLFFKVILPALGFETYYIRAIDPNAPTPPPTPPPTSSSSSSSTSASPSTSADPSTSSSTSSVPPSSSSTSSAPPSSSSTASSSPSRSYGASFITPNHVRTEREESTDDSFVFNGTLLKLYFPSTKSSFSTVQYKATNITFQQTFLVYESFNGTSQKSGPYVFRPNNRTWELALAQSTHLDGPFLADAYQEFAYQDTSYTVTRDANGVPTYEYFDNTTVYTLVKQHIRMFRDDDPDMGNFIEFSHAVSEMPRIPNGRELISRFLSSLDADSWFTDSNGFRFTRRVFNPNISSPISGNYYPSVYSSYVTTNTSAIGFVWDRAHGVSSPTPGDLDVMLHRRITTDDGKGITLDDDFAINATMRIVFGTGPKDILPQIYRHTYLVNYRPLVTVGAPIAIEDMANRTFITNFTMLNATTPLPPNIHIIDFKKLANAPANNTFILRLGHLFDIGEASKELTDPVELNMRYFFNAPYCISSLNSTFLSGNRVKEIIYVDGLAGDPPNITLLPKQIRTLLIQVEHDRDNCEGNLCGDGNACIDLPCAYHCSCAFGKRYDSATKTCVDNPPSDFERIFTNLFKSLPVLIMSYLTFVCAYSIRGELRKIAIASGMPTASRFRLLRFCCRETESQGSTGGSINGNTGGSTGGSSSRSSRRRASGDNGQGNRFSRFMQANKRALERVFFPTALQNRHQD